MTEIAMQNSAATRLPADEEALIQRARREPAAFGSLYDIYVQPIYHYLYSRSGSAVEAEDLTAQTFLTALEAFPRYRHQGYFSAWLFAIARSKMVDAFRRSAHETGLEQAESLPARVDLLAGAIRAERSAALNASLAALSEDERELLRLRYVAELKFAEIAMILGKQEDAVKKTTYRMLARLQSQLEDQDE